MKMLTKASDIFDQIINLLAIFAGILIVFLMLIVTTEVGMRAILGRSIVWTLEVSGFSLLYITFLVAAWVLRREGHVRMDLVLNQLNPRTQAMVNTVTSVVGILICLVIAWYGVRVTWDYFQLGYYESYAMLKPPKFILIAIIPVGSSMLLVQFLRRTYRCLREWRALQGQD